MDGNGGLVLIGPNAYPIIESAAILAAVFWCIDRWSKQLPLLPSWMMTWKRRPATTGDEAALQEVQEPSRAVAPLHTAPVLTMSQWLDRVNNHPDRVPHLAASGPSGSGKTTLILAVLHVRPGRFVIVTPKSKRADAWGGLPVIRLRAEDMSFAPIGAAIEAVYAEMLRRNAENADVEDDWLTLVIDEFSTVIGKLPELKEKVLDMVTLGRSSRIRVIILATETNVKAWGWEGRGEARHNVLFVECEEETYRAALFRWGKPPEQMDTRWVPELASKPMLPSRWWGGVSSISLDTPEGDKVLRAALSSAVESTASVRPQFEGGDFESNQRTDGRTDGRTEHIEAEKLVKALKVAGLSRDATRKVLSDISISMSNARISEIRNEEG